MTTADRGAEHLSMAQHPDIVALRERYARANENFLAQAVEGLIFLAGTYAAISPWVIGFNRSSPNLVASNLIVGIAVALLALGFASAYERTHGMSWVVVAMGIWLIITPWVVTGVTTTTSMLWSNIVVGACVVVLGLIAFTLGLMRSR